MVAHFHVLVVKVNAQRPPSSVLDPEYYKSLFIHLHSLAMPLAHIELSVN